MSQTTCSTDPGATHYHGCACSEDAWIKEVQFAYRKGISHALALIQAAHPVDIALNQEWSEADLEIWRVMELLKGEIGG